MSSFRDVEALMEAMEPFVLECSDGQGGGAFMLQAPYAATLMNTMRKLQRKDVDDERFSLMMAASAKLVARGCATLSPKHLSLSLNAFKDAPPLSEAASELFTASLQRIKNLVSSESWRDFPPQTIAMIANAYTTRHTKIPAGDKSSREASQAVAQMVKVTLSMDPWDFPLQSTAMIASSLARLGKPNVVAMAFLSQAAQASPSKDFTSKGVAALLHAEYLVGEGKDEHLIERLCRELSTIPPQRQSGPTLALSALTLSQMGRCSSPVWNHLASSAMTIPFGSFDQQSVVDSVRAFLAAGKLGPELADRLCRAACEIEGGRGLPLVLQGLLQASRLAESSPSSKKSLPSSSLSVCLTSISNSLTPLSMEALSLSTHTAVTFYLSESTSSPSLSTLIESFALQVFSRIKTGHGMSLKFLVSLVRNLSKFRRHYESQRSTSIRIESPDGFSRPAFNETHVALAATVPWSRLFSALSDAAQANTHEYDAQTLSEMLVAFSKCGVSCPSLFSHLEQEMQLIPPSCWEPQSLSLAAHVLNSRGTCDPSLMSYIANATSLCIAGSRPLRPHHVSLLLNAFGRQDSTNHPGLFSILSDAAKTIPLQFFDSQAVAGLVNAMARVGVTDYDLIAYLSPAIFRSPERSSSSEGTSDGLEGKEDNITGDQEGVQGRNDVRSELEFSAQETALIVNALSKFGSVDSVLLKSLSARIQLLETASFDAQAVANIVNGFARLGVTDRPLLFFLAEVVLEMNATMLVANNCRHVGSIMNAFAKLRTAHTPLFRHLARHSTEHFRRVLKASDDGPLRDCEVGFLTDGGAQTTALMMHAMAMLDDVQEDLSQAILDGFVRCDSNVFQAQSVANIAWSVAVLELARPDVDEWIRACLSQHVGVMDRASLTQTHQYILHSALSLSRLADTRNTWALLGKSRPSQDIMSGSVTTSRLQSEVANSLHEMGFEIKEEYLDKNSGYLVDIWIPALSLAVEVDGPSHYSWDEAKQRKELGSTKLKHRLMRMLGLRLKVMPYWHWPKGPGAKQRRLEYLNQLLSETTSLSI